MELPGAGEAMFFRRVPKGRFRMGSRGFDEDEEPAHWVEMAADFYLGTFPVTQQQFDAWMDSMGKRHRHWFEGGGLLPAEQVTWAEAVEFCEWLGAERRLPAGWVATLPTETEWEYACRAGTTTEYWSGDGEAALAEVGWYDHNSGRRTHAVGELPANAWGLFDMHGNVWEWCVDRWKIHAYRTRRDGEAYEPRRARERAALGDSQAARVVRGGSWGDSAGWCRSAYRIRWRPGDRNPFQGFRVCLLPGPVVPAGSSAEASGERARDGTERDAPERAGARPARSGLGSVTPSVPPARFGSRTTSEDEHR
ncbi:MAG: formylglycine-generating enzyme family protein [Planctomycetota bacterium]